MPSTPVLAAAQRLTNAGLGVIPIRADGSKAPRLSAGEVEQYRERYATPEEFERWFAPGNAVGVAVVGGKISGNLAVLDFESQAAWDGWLRRLDESGLTERIATFPLVRTPKGGRHLYCKIREGWVAGCKLASRSNKETLIEIRGQGHYVLAPGCPPACHERNIAYEFERAGWIDTPEVEADCDTLTLDEFDAFCTLAREFNEWVPVERTRSASPALSDAKGTRPGDDYNRRATWGEILEPAGWTVDRTSGSVTYWTRPGKDRGVSATTGRCSTEASGDLLYVFSSNADPLEMETAYSKFAALAYLHHGGDFSTAARELASRGFGEDAPRTPFGKGPIVSFDGGSLPEPSGRKFKWAGELSAPPRVDEWLWQGYLPRAGIVLLSALSKAGKTTMISHMLRAFGSDGEFLGQQIKAAKILYVSEEGERLWVRRRDDLGLGDHIGFYLQPFAVRPAPLDWLGFIAQLKADVIEHGFDLVVFDTLAKLWPCKDENASVEVDAALMPLWELTKANAAVLLVHHLRKNGGSEYTGSRGSGALTAFPDLIIELTRFDANDHRCQKRKLNAKGRYDETPDELIIELVDDKRRYVPIQSAGDGPTVSFSHTADNGNNVDLQPPSINRGLSVEEHRIVTVLTISPDPFLTVDEIRAALRANKWGMRDEDVKTHLFALFQKGQVQSSGELRSKTNPKVYGLSSHSAPESLGGNEIRDGEV